MSSNSHIEWTDATWNPVSGCAPVSAGCANCYAVRETHRHHHHPKYHGLTVLNGAGTRRHFNGVVRCHEDALAIPLGWRAPRRVFVNSMSDLFFGTEGDRAHCERRGVPFEPVPFEFIAKVYAVAALCRQHTLQILTKRPERAAEFYEWLGAVTDMVPMPVLRAMASFDERVAAANQDMVWPLPNVWLGTSCENQAAADERIPHLLRCPAAVRFLSCEPLLGELRLPRLWMMRPLYDCSGCGKAKRSDFCDACGKITNTPTNTLRGIDWVIVGGESGGGARPCNVEWVRSIVRQCKGAGVPVFVKQLGAKPVITDLQRPTPDGEWIERWLDTGVPYQIAGGCAEARIEIHPSDRKGGDWDEWPEDLRVREFPGGENGASGTGHQASAGGVRELLKGTERA